MVNQILNSNLQSILHKGLSNFANYVSVLFEFNILSDFQEL